MRKYFVNMICAIHTEQKWKIYNIYLRTMAMIDLVCDSPMISTVEIKQQQ